MLFIDGRIRSQVEATKQDKIAETQSITDNTTDCCETLPEQEDASSMIVTFRFDVCISHQEHREDQGYYIPSRENEAKGKWKLVNTVTAS